MSTAERKEHQAIEQMTKRVSSTAYLSARRANIPVTFARGGVIYRVTNGERVAIGEVSPAVKVTQKVVLLKRSNE